MTPNPQIVYRILYKSRLKMSVLPHEAAGCHHLVDNEPGWKLANSSPFSLDHFVHNEVECLIGQSQTLTFGFLLKDTLVHFQLRPSYLDFVWKTAQECGSIRSSGSRLVEKMTNSSNGIVKLLPVCSFR